MEPKLPRDLEFVEKDTEQRELFVSSKCVHCQELMADREAFEAKFAGYEIFDITESMANLRHFLGYRDRLEGYREVKNAGNVGIPSVVTGGIDVSFPGEV